MKYTLKCMVKDAFVLYSYTLLLPVSCPLLLWKEGCKTCQGYPFSSKSSIHFFKRIPKEFYFLFWFSFQDPFIKSLIMIYAHSGLLPQCHTYRTLRGKSMGSAIWKALQTDSQESSHSVPALNVIMIGLGKQDAHLRNHRESSYSIELPENRKQCLKWFLEKYN